MGSDDVWKLYRNTSLSRSRSLLFWCLRTETPSRLEPNEREQQSSRRSGHSRVRAMLHLSKYEH